MVEDEKLHSAMWKFTSLVAETRAPLKCRAPAIVTFLLFPNLFSFCSLAS